jgi:hypothetical protein
VTPRRALVAGWFSFEGMGATAGDLLAGRLVQRWADDGGLPNDLAISSTLSHLARGIQLDHADPAAYSHLAFVCGPCGEGPPPVDLLGRFEHTVRVGVDLSMLDPLERWQPFDMLLERDSDRATRPDITFAAELEPVPVVGVMLVHHQREYAGAAHEEAEARISALLERHTAARIAVDTCFDPANATGLRTPAEVESVVARLDLLVTTRLHGLALALKNGVPVIAVDPIRGGAKVAAQGAALGWPHTYRVEHATDDALDDAFAACLDDSARERAREAGARAAVDVEATKREFQRFVAGS